MHHSHFSYLFALLLCLVVVIGGESCKETPCAACPEPVACKAEPAPDARAPERSPPPERPEPEKAPEQQPLERQAPEPSPERRVPPPAPTRCGPPTGTFYQPPETLPTKAGALVRCEFLGVNTAAAIGADARYAGTAGAAAMYGARLLRIMYVTEAPAGQFQATTALVYIPYTGTQCLPAAPIALVAHGTTGMAPHCGPSRFPNFGVHHLAWPLVGRGAVVVAPDLLGLGARSAGGHPYLVTAPTQRAMFDALRAAAALGSLADQSGCIGRRVLLLGHSQGGHAALVGGQAFSSMLTGFQHAGTVAIAPAFGDERVWLGPFQASLVAGVPTAYYLAYLVAAARYRKGPALSQWLTTRAAAQVPGWLDSFCFSEWTSLLLHNFVTFGDIFSPAFLTASQTCQGGKGDCKDFAPWVAAVRDSLVQGNATQAPTLLVQGGQDAVVSATSVGCISKRFKDKGASVATCVLPSADHISVIAGSWGGTLPWIQAALAGKPLPAPTCVSSALPACP